MEEEKLEKYCQFIRVIQNRIDEHFEKQKEYIHCKEGCAYCCKNGEYPCSELEFEFIKLGFMSLDKEIQQKIINNVLKIKADKAANTKDKFIYECPFLLDDRCSIYKYRMIICRTFGLSYYDKDDDKKKNTLKVPFCMHQGLNYSEVYDQNKKVFSTDLYRKLGYLNEPMAYSLGVESLMDKFGKDIMHIDFGEIKTLIEWL